MIGYGGSSYLTVKDGGTLGPAAAVRSEDFEKVFYVSAVIRGPGLGSDSVGTWAPNSLKVGEGLIIAADSIAREFSDWGSAAAEGSPAAEVRGLDNNGAQESRDCLSSLGDGARERLGNGDAARGVLRLAAVIPVPLTALAHVPVTAAPGEREVRFVREFFEQGKPVGAICHGIWMLVEADVVDGRTLTSWPSLKTDVANAGGTWVDKEVVVDRGLVTSRKPDDLPAFCRKLVEEISEGVHAEQAEAVRS